MQCFFQSLCIACGIKFKQAKESIPIKDQRNEPFTGSNIGVENDDGEVRIICFDV